MPHTLLNAGIPPGEQLSADLARQVRQNVCPIWSYPNYVLDPHDPTASAGTPLYAAEEPPYAVEEGMVEVTLFALHDPVRLGVDESANVDDHLVKTESGPRTLEVIQHAVSERRLNWVRRTRLIIAAGNQIMEFDDEHPNGEPIDDPWWQPQIKDEEFEDVVNAYFYWGGWFEDIPQAPSITPEFAHAGLTQVNERVEAAVTRTLGSGLAVVTKHLFTTDDEVRRKIDNAATVSMSLGLSNRVDEGKLRDDLVEEAVGEVHDVLRSDIDSRASVFGTTDPSTRHLYQYYRAIGGVTFTP
jgi:hypothetical protein